LLRVNNPFEMAAMLAVTVPRELHDGTFSSASWLADPRNVALRIGPDLGMAEYFGSGVYLLHVWFQSRGKDAIDRAKAMIGEMFDTYGATRLRVEIPRQGRRTAFVARRVGFTMSGEVDRPLGKVMLGELTRAHWTHHEKALAA
jgi:hypothetical protein